MVRAAPIVVIVTGLPCTGKSTLAARLRQEFSLPLIAKDRVKEQLFDVLDWGDAGRSRSLSLASYGLMFEWAGEIVSAGGSCILEGNFRPQEHIQSFQSLSSVPGARFVQILCRAPGEVLTARFLEGARRKGERHPGHADLENFGRIEAELRSGEAQSLALAGPVLEFDTGAGFDMEPLLARLAPLLGRG